MKDAASSNVIPMALDEFKPSKIDKYRLDALLNHFRNSYDGQEGIRGRADQSIVSYELLALTLPRLNGHDKRTVS